MLPARGHQGRAHPPVDPHRPAAGPLGQRGLRCGERDMPAARPVHRHPRHAQVRGQGAGPPEPHPSAFGHLHLTPAAGHPPHPGVPDHKPLRAALTAVPRLPAGLPVWKNAAIALSKSRSACCCTDDEPSASHRSAARAWASCRPRSAPPGAAPRPGHHHDCCSTARFHTNRASAQWRHRTPTCAAAGYNRFLTATAADHTPALRQPPATTAEARTWLPPSTPTWPP